MAIENEETREWVEACGPGESRTITVGEMSLTVDRRPISAPTVHEHELKSELRGES